MVLDATERRHEILRQAEAAAEREGLALRSDIGLLDEVTGLVENPDVLVGTIDQAFMDVPDEVLITSMRSHQKYFSLLKADGRLANRFLVVSNMTASRWRQSHRRRQRAGSARPPVRRQVLLGH